MKRTEPAVLFPCALGSLPSSAMSSYPCALDWAVGLWFDCTISTSVCRLGPASPFRPAGRGWRRLHRPSNLEIWHLEGPPGGSLVERVKNPVCGRGPTERSLNGTVGCATVWPDVALPVIMILLASE